MTNFLTYSIRPLSLSLSLLTWSSKSSFIMNWDDGKRLSNLVSLIINQLSWIYRMKTLYSTFFFWNCWLTSSYYCIKYIIREYRVFFTRIFAYNYRIYDFVVIREKKDEKNPCFCIFYTAHAIVVNVLLKNILSTILVIIFWQFLII